MPSPKTISIRLNVWADPRTGMIHLASKEAGIISTVSSEPKSERYHPNLFRKLRRLLIGANKWPKGL